MVAVERPRRVYGSENSYINPKAVISSKCGAKRVALGDVTNQVTRQRNVVQELKAQGVPDIQEIDLVSTDDEYMEDDSLGNAELDLVSDYDDYPAPLLPMASASTSMHLQRTFWTYNSGQLDKDDEDTFDTGMVAEYSPEIYNYLHELEVKYRPNPNYIKFQPELRWTYRATLIDWLVQVHQRFNLLPETLFLTVNIIDRFLSKRTVTTARFQLVGAAALFIAAKYEEINCPTIKEMAYMLDNAYSVEDIKKAEKFMIDVLEFQLGWPGPMSFLRRVSKADDYDYDIRTLAKYLLELTVMEFSLLSAPPSWLAAGAYMCSAIMLRGDRVWKESHVYYSGYTEEQLEPLVEKILESCRQAKTHHKAIFDKYSDRKYRRCSQLVQEWLQMNEQMGQQ